PFEPFHVSRGFSREQSTVTVVGAEAPHSVFAVPSAAPGDPQGVERLLTVLAQALSGFGTNNRIAPRSAVTIVLTPVHAKVFAEKGYGRAEVQRAIFERTHRKRREILEYAGILGALVPPGDPDETLSIVDRPENILVVVAGGAGYYSVVMPGWCGGEHGNLPVTKEIQRSPSCELPGAA
ncbi:MAG: hypothetical protein ACREQY_19715, partial [Candidatus Binatia bacterium]